MSAARLASDLPRVIDVKGLTKSFHGRLAVKGIDLDVRKGEVLGFLGPNGSGKTTTIRMLCGLLRADAGEGTCLGYDLRRETNEIKRETGYMTQRFSFYEDLSIRENLDFVARLYALKDRKRRVDETLARLGLEQRAGQLAGELSGGWKQRLALAACVMHEPKLLLLDEPTAGVDPKARREFWDEIHTLTAQGLTVLVSTHYMDEAERCDRVVYIFNGTIVVRGSVAEVIESSKLATFVVRGPDPNALMAAIRKLPAVEQVAAFGPVLHVVGHDRKALARVLERLRGETGITVFPGETTLEDVFIRYMETGSHGA
jgi:ABC-2 type transport system ATP-binding protein